MNIMVIGHPGSGKTYLANLLSKKSGTEKIDIDILFDKHPFYGLSKGLYKKALGKIIKDKRDWVIDGYHVGLTPDELFTDANLVIYLNLPKDELKRNVRARYKAKKAKNEFSHWQSVYLNNLKNFGQIRFQDKALKKDVVRIRGLTTNKAKFIELTTRDEIAQFLDSFPVGF